MVAHMIFPLIAAVAATATKMAAKHQYFTEEHRNIDQGGLDRDGYDGINRGSPNMGDDPGFELSLVLAIIFGSCMVLGIVASVAGAVVMLIRKKFTLSEADLIRQEENQVYLELDGEEQELYFQSRDYLAENPYFRNELTLSQNLLIQEKGIHAWEFVKDPMLTSNELLIINKYELNFFKKMECSTQTNLPIPMKNDVYYFESKIYSLPNADTTKMSIGLGIRPYPWFRLPGRHAHSISYDSDGYRRHNQPFNFTNEPPFPKLIEGDVVGVGYRVRSGTVFFTRNGKKISESKIGGHIKHFKIPNEGQIFPIIGANNLCSIHVNVGQMGFVFIEAQVKKWGFAPLEGSGPAPPAYNKFNSDILLERSEIDDNDLSERDSDFPPDFWQAQSEDENDNEFDLNENDKFSYNAEAEVHSEAERITLNSLMPPLTPPSYEPAEDEDDADDENDNEQENNMEIEEGYIEESNEVEGQSEDSEAHSSENSQAPESVEQAEVDGQEISKTQISRDEDQEIDNDNTESNVEIEVVSNADSDVE